MKENKTRVFSYSLLLLLASSTIMAVLPLAFAQEIEYSKETHAYIGAIPNPVGVGQQVLLHVGITDFLKVYSDSWEGLTVTVTKPDGTTETLGPYRTDSTGGTGGVFIPEMVGTYKFQTHFPEQNYDWDGGVSRVPFTGVVTYEASDSDILELVVTEVQNEYYVPNPLPNEYWSRPIDAQLREWSTIAGNWLTTPTGMFAPYNDGPETPHILWAKDLERGGLAGGMYGPQSYQCGDAYEGKFASSVIIAGVLYYNRFTDTGRGGPPAQGIVAVDLHTGEELWFKNDTRLSFGQIFYWDSFNYHATFGYLWSTSGDTWTAYDIQTGEWVYTLTNVPSGTTVRGPKGEIYIYTVDLTDGWISLWNSSSAVQPMATGGSGDGSWQRQIGRNSDRVFDAMETGIEWNVTITSGLSGSVGAAFFEEKLVGTSAPGRSNQGIESDPIEMWAISLEPGQEGTLLWEKTWQPPTGDITFGFAEASIDDDVFILSTKETRSHYGFSFNNGELLWETEPQDYLDIFGGRDALAYGKYFSIGMSGIIYCYNVRSGDLLWTYKAPDNLGEVLWTNQWHIRPVFITDEKIYLGTSEHSPIDPKPRGAAFVCVDVNNGNEVWRADGLFRQTDWGGRAIIGDSIMATMDTYDQRIYAVGKGPSSTTLEAAPKAIAKGTSVVIEGMVTDISPGTEDLSIKMRFPNGVPVIADDSMSEWMLYVYKQFEKPTEAIGVEVRIEAINPNGEYQYIDTVTTDSNGFYNYVFKPELEGKYTLMASFMGSKSYYSSLAQTTISVDPSITASTPISAEETGLITTETAIIAAIAVAAIIGVAAYWFLKRK